MKKKKNRTVHPMRAPHSAPAPAPDLPPPQLLVPPPGPAPITASIKTIGWMYLRFEVVRLMLGRLFNQDYGVKLGKLHIRVGWY